ncbi:MAG: DegT/DnrJ/EryC1/StrS family aminotransferase [Cyclobacteriaceae bacterium]|nr:DegT/DnrJ/EryC1/StrS family aminotransferase [Cyclobacteriaceae bacterium]
MNFRIPLSYNPVQPDEIAAVLRYYENRHHNDMIHDFEVAISRMAGTRLAVALSSGTAAIHLALKALGVGSGDYVVAPTFTYVATVNPVLYVGAKPVFIDSEPVTWNMDPELLSVALDQLYADGILPKAIIVVHTYGTMADMEKINAIAGKWEIPVVEDAAEAVGSSIKGRSAGSWSRIGIFSFNNNKLLTSYGGGAVVTDDEDLAARVRFLAAQSRESSLHYQHAEIGYNYQMGPVNAACGLVSLRHFPERLQQRLELFEAYRHRLSSHFIFQGSLNHSFSNRWLTAGLAEKSSIRDLFFTKLRQSGIEVRLCWKPMHQQPLFHHTRSFITGTSVKLFERGICLPSGCNVKKSDVERIVSYIEKSL